MAGLCAAARACELGARPDVLEKGTRAGGSMLLSSCVVWRHRRFEDFRVECPGGDEELQRIVFERLDEGLAWLERLGAPVVARETGNPRTTGYRFDPRGLRDALLEAMGTEVRLETQVTQCYLENPFVLATGGFQGDATLVAEHIRPEGRLRLRANRWSDGDGLRAGLAQGAARSAGLDEFYGRNMPDCDFDENDFVSLAQLYGRYVRVYNERGEEFFQGEISWSENDLVQATARQPNARAFYVVDDAALEQPVRERSVRDYVEAAPTRLEPSDLPFPAPADAVAAVRVKPGITHTIGGLRIDGNARVLDGQGTPIERLYACGADAGGISTGGYASGLAAALVLGRTAAETALS